jgi:aspartate/methionine/tyrosine aminotransferase
VASPVQYAPQRTILLRGFGKSYGVTGWRMGYAAGPAELITAMGNMQQYTFVCAPSIAQHGILAAMDVDMSGVTQAYRNKRDLVAAELQGRYEFTRPSGGFYFFLKVPARYASGTKFAEAALERKLLCVPGCVFGGRDTHVRISYAAPDATLRRGCEILKAMA